MHGRGRADHRAPGRRLPGAINPADYKHSFGIAYAGSNPDDGRPIGKSGVTPKFSSVNSEKIAFSIVLDGTGVVPDAAGRAVADQMRQLKAIVYSYSGSDHEPNVVKIAWGRGLTAFYGRLESMSADYTLFRAHRRGAPGQGGLELHQLLDPDGGGAHGAALLSRHDPHGPVKAGDTLPLLCQRIYRDASKYLEIARLNDLDGFRALAPGSELQFPPMR